MPRKKKAPAEPEKAPEAKPLEAPAFDELQDIDDADSDYDSTEEAPQSNDVQASQNPEKTDYLKYFLIGIIVAFVIGGSLIAVKSLSKDDGWLIKPPTSISGLAVLNPSEDVGEGWNMSFQATNLAQLDPESRAQFLYQNVKDAAQWEFTRGTDELMLIWVRVYPDAETLQKNNMFFTNNFAWLTTTYLPFAEYGRIGGYRAEGASVPLMLYAEKYNTTMLYIVYYNVEGDKYTTENMEQDKKMLADIGRALYGKLDLYNEFNKDLNNTAEQIEA
jgi:hypothetical protein